MMSMLRPHVGHTPTAQVNLKELGDPIWTNIYPVWVRYIDSLTDEHHRNIGVPDTGNRILNKQMYHDPVNIMITIDAMVEYYKRGVTVHFRVHQHTYDVYTIVNNYLLGWKQVLENGLNLGNAPVQDLLLLDKYAEALHPVAIKFGAPIRSTGSLFANLATGAGMFASRGSFFRQGQSETEPQEAPKHNSVGNDLAKAIANLGNWKG